ncbi:hypothetical protein [Streptomyces sp. NPDC002276]
MRLSVRALVSALDPEDQDHALHWLDHGQWMAVLRLKAAEPGTFTARAGESQVEWSARPVAFLLVRRACAGGSRLHSASALTALAARFVRNS